MDISSVIGLVLALGAIVGSIAAGGSFGVFVDVPSMIVVCVGVIGVTMIKWPMEVVVSVVKVSLKVVFTTNADPKAAIVEIGELAEKARRESVFALEAVPIDDPFLKKAMLLAADNRPPEVIASILQLEIDSVEARHKVGQDLLSGIADDGPAFGMIGTLIGLVIMLQNLSDPSSLGPAMAIALLTTFYGACIANVYANPFKSKLEIRSVMEITKMNIVVAGTLGIVAGENPRLIQEKLASFLPPGLRDFGDAAGGKEE